MAEPLLKSDRKLSRQHSALTAAAPDEIHDEAFKEKSFREKVRVFHDKFIMSNAIMSKSEIAMLVVYYLLVGVLTWCVPLYFLLKPVGATWPEWVNSACTEANMRKFIVFNVLHGVVGLGATNGPLGGRLEIPLFEPLLVYLTPGTLASPLVPCLVGCVLKTPGKRSLMAVLAFVAYLVSLVLALIAPSITLRELCPIYISLVACCVFDFSIFFASRGEHYVYQMICMAFPDWIHGCQCVQFVVWFGAGVSKVGPWFKWVMLMLPRGTIWSPFLPTGSTAKLLSKNAPEDTSPSGVTVVLAKLGFIGEFVFPICCLFPPGGWMNSVGVYGMICYHAFIAATLPAASVFEWQYYCMVMSYVLYAKHYFHLPTSPGLLAFLSVVLIIFPVVGQLNGKLVPFLMGYRQYAGNWRMSFIFLKPDAKHKLKKIKTWSNPVMGDLIPPEQGGPDALLDICGQFFTVPQFRGFCSILEAYEKSSGQSLRDYEFIPTGVFFNSTNGWELAVGWLHFRECWRNAILDICGFEPNEFLVVQVEPVSPFPPHTSEYRLMDIVKGPMDAEVYANVPYHELEGPSAMDTYVKPERISTRCKSIRGTFLDTYY